jgi:hypothetical protein
LKILPQPPRTAKVICGSAAWIGTAAVIAGCLAPAWRDWSHTVVGPFGGIDAVLQVGLLEWSARTWWQPGVWLDLPIFYPLSGAIGFMDSLVGQALLVWPLRMLFDPTPAGLYNYSFLGSLTLAAMGMAALYRASGGSRWAAPFAALALVGAPYTLAQIGHLNQLPPPFVLFSLAALTAALRREDANLPAIRFWWLLAACLVLQAAWGWYGFSYAAIGVVVLATAWVFNRYRRRKSGWRFVRRVAIHAGLPTVLAAVCVVILAQPQLQLGQRYSDFTRTDDEVRLGSADLKHFFNRGVYRSGPADWVGQGAVGEPRYDGKDRQVLNPGWLVLILAGVGWWRRGYLSFQRRRSGRSLLIMGMVGLVFAFGDSMGLPFTDRRLPLPLDLIRELVPPFKAFRGAWRFSWLLVIALSWWSAVALELFVDRRGYRKVPAIVPVVLVLLMTLVSLPVAVPGLEVPLDGRAQTARLLVTGPVLTLPAPENEYAEDIAEAGWLLRSLQTGQPVSGGATGWVPPEVRHLRTRLKSCEEGDGLALDLLADLSSQGFVLAEIVLREGDESRVAFWRQALEELGAEKYEPWPQDGYAMYRLPR